MSLDEDRHLQFGHATATGTTKRPMLPAAAGMHQRIHDPMGKSGHCFEKMGSARSATGWHAGHAIGKKGNAGATWSRQSAATRAIEGVTPTMDVP